LDDDGCVLTRKLEFAYGFANQCRARGEDAEIIEVLAVFDEAAVRGFAQEGASLRERFLGGCDGEDDVALGEDEIRRRGLVAARATQATICTAAGSELVNSASDLP
jgi:hypothetical protein